VQRRVACAFRAANPGDRAFIERVSRSSFADYARDPAKSIGWMAGERTALVELAVDANAELGFFILRLIRLERTFGPWSSPAVARLDAVAVAPEARRRGIGRALLQQAEQTAIDEGAVVMSLATANHNHAARRLFTEMGYQELAPLGVYYRGGQHAIAMVRSLPQS